MLIVPKWERGVAKRPQQAVCSCRKYFCCRFLCTVSAVSEASIGGGFFLEDLCQLHLLLLYALCDL